MRACLPRRQCCPSLANSNPVLNDRSVRGTWLPSRVADCGDSISENAINVRVSFMINKVETTPDQRQCGAIDMALAPHRLTGQLTDETYLDILEAVPDAL